QLLPGREVCQKKAERDRAHEGRSSKGEREDHGATRAATKHQFATIATAIAMRAKRAPDGPSRGARRGTPQRRSAVTTAKPIPPIAIRLASGLARKAAPGSRWATAAKAWRHPQPRQGNP